MLAAARPRGRVGKEDKREQEKEDGGGEGGTEKSGKARHGAAGPRLRFNSLITAATTTRSGR